MTARATAAALGERILAQLAGHDSKRPARADDLLALVGGDESAFWSAIEALKGTSQINCAHIKGPRDPEPWLAIWPTGIPARMDTWHDLNARGHFNTHRPFTQQRMPQTLTARRAAQEIEMKQSPQATVQRRDKIAALVAGRPLADGLPLKALAAELDIGVEGVRLLIKSMLGGQRVALGKLPKEHGHRAYDPSVNSTAADHSGVSTEMAEHLEDHFRDATKMVEQPAHEAAGSSRQGILDSSAAQPPAETPAPLVTPVDPVDPVCAGLAAIADALGDMEPADDIDITAAAAQVCETTRQKVQFALWDDGGVSIYDGDELLQLPPADVARLARLLGVPGCQLASGVAA